MISFSVAVSANSLFNFEVRKIDMEELFSNSEMQCTHKKSIASHSSLHANCYYTPLENTSYGVRQNIYEADLSIPFHTSSYSCVFWRISWAAYLLKNMSSLYIKKNMNIYIIKCCHYCYHSAYYYGYSLRSILQRNRVYGSVLGWARLGSWTRQDRM